MMHGQMTYGRRDNARIIVKVNVGVFMMDLMYIGSLPSKVYRVPRLRHSKRGGSYCLLLLQQTV